MTIEEVFVPMYGDSFFTAFELKEEFGFEVEFSSPCMGILFSRQH